MTVASPRMSDSMRALGRAIAEHPEHVTAAMCGFDLWVEVLGSKFIEPRKYKPGGEIADGSEPETELVVPVMAIRGDIVVSFDPSLPPEGFELRS